MRFAIAMARARLFILRLGLVVRLRLGVKMAVRLNAGPRLLLFAMSAGSRMCGDGTI